MESRWQSHTAVHGSLSLSRARVGAELEIAITRRKFGTGDCVASCVIVGESLVGMDLRGRLVDGLLSARFRWPALACSIEWARRGEDDDMPHVRYDVPTAESARRWATNALTLLPPSDAGGYGSGPLHLCRTRDIDNDPLLVVLAQLIDHEALEITYVRSPRKAR